MRRIWWFLRDVYDALVENLLLLWLVMASLLVMMLVGAR